LNKRVAKGVAELIMKTFFVFLLAAVLMTSCATPGRVGVTPDPSTSDYFITRGAGFALKLDDQKKIVSCQYSLLLVPRQTISRPLYLRTRFDNPADPNKPLVTDSDIQPGSEKILISSPEVRGLQSHLNYKAEVLVFDSLDRIRQIGRHIQYVRYTQLSWIK
jgi:hypothetical protein